MRPEEVFVVVPAHNEAAAIEQTLAPLVKGGFSVVVVDDGSFDGTWAVISRLRVHAVRHPLNLGQGAALQTGVTYALRRGAPIIVHMDADGQHRAEEIESLVAPILSGEADVVLGSRFLRREDRCEVPPLRRAILRGGTLVNGLLTGVWLSDAHNGFRAMTRQAALQIHLRENGYAHASEILLEIRRHRLRYLERPTHIVYTTYARRKGQSLGNSLNILIDLLIRRIFP